MQYVYKYVLSGETLYVGITSNMERRVREHTYDKLADIAPKSTIFYFPVMTRGDAEILETYLISYYNTGKHFNEAKTSKGEHHFLGDLCENLPWMPYEGKTDLYASPYVLSAIRCHQVKPKVIVQKNSKARMVRIKYSIFTSEAFQRMSTGAKYLFLCLLAECDGESGFSFTGTMMNKFGVSRTSGFRYIAEMEEAGLIEQTYSGKAAVRASRYEWRTA